MVAQQDEIPCPSGPTEGERDIYRDKFWFAIAVKPRYEQVIASALQAKDLQAFVPVYKARRRWSDRVKEVKLPLFPGYVFGHFAWNQRNVTCTLPGFIRVVTFGERPTPIDDREIQTLRQIADAGGLVEPYPFLREGQRVRIKKGALAGIEGILVTGGGAPRLAVSITLLQRSVAV